MSHAVFVAAIALQLFALYIPRAPTPGGADVPGSDKVVHLLLFALVMLTGRFAGVPTRWLAPVLVAHAVVSEVIQGVVLSQRNGDPLDALADAAGILVGWYLSTMLLRHRSRRGNSHQSY